MRKIKSFTLIEIMVASLIFLVVVSTATSAFALIRSSNMKADDVRLADQCARQVREKLSEVVRANQLQSRIAGVQYSSTGRFTLVESDNTNTDYIGVAVFDSETTAKVIYKSAGIYYIRDYELSTPSTIRATTNNRPIIMSADCLAFGEKPDNMVWSGDFVKPFKVYYQKHYPDYDATKKEDKIFKIVLSDLVFRAHDNGSIDVEDEYSSVQKQTISKLFVDLTNNSRKLW